MTLTIEKTDAFVARPFLLSGMQRATVNGGVGYPAILAGAFVPGASVGGPIESEYHAVPGVAPVTDFGMTPGEDGFGIHGYDPQGGVGSIDPLNTVLFEEVWVDDSNNEVVVIVAVDVEGWSPSPIQMAFQGIGGPVVITLRSRNPEEWGEEPLANGPALVAFFTANLGVPITFTVVPFPQPVGAFGMTVGTDGSAWGYSLAPLYGAVNPGNTVPFEYITVDGSETFVRVITDTLGWGTNPVTFTFYGIFGPCTVVLPNNGANVWRGNNNVSEMLLFMQRNDTFSITFDAAP